ncbi:TetR/AcrR family transcriptional regulator [Psychroserpens damuponensis]|uniref:TetR/AcrR family transcriptional regulator n=1 Tax=Psychroserpens damuponensis TaxID=943936 RepID=UPI00058F154B|nr:TetR/AcrR family transcriptional regulator [Psychroserpens damuponensis]
MNKTKKRILEVSLELFNANGISNVSLRTISDKMGISIGNLTYHFKKRDEIIEAHYFQLVEDYETSMTKIKFADSTLMVLLQMSYLLMRDIYRYRFILVDLVHILQEDTIIREHYIELSKSREQQFDEIFKSLIEQGEMRKEILDNEYKFFFLRLKILADFWISSLRVENRPLNEDVISEYEEIIIQSFFPYLTDQGRKNYLLIRNKKLVSH